VSAISASTKTLTTATGEVIAFDKVLVATGSVARKLTVPGADLPQVFTVRAPQVLRHTDFCAVLYVGSVRWQGK
jgi:NAD(P)H-nitrite reductase large subunit